MANRNLVGHSKLKPLAPSLIYAMAKHPSGLLRLIAGGQLRYSGARRIAQGAEARCTWLVGWRDTVSPMCEAGNIPRCVSVASPPCGELQGIGRQAAEQAFVSSLSFVRMRSSSALRQQSAQRKRLPRRLCPPQTPRSKPGSGKVGALRRPWAKHWRAGQIIPHLAKTE